MHRTNYCSHHSGEVFTLDFQKFCCFKTNIVFLLQILVFLINCTRYLYISRWLGRGHWTEMFILQPVCVILPLLPLVFPVAWFLLNAFGLTKIRAILQDSTLTQVCKRGGFKIFLFSCKLTRHFVDCQVLDPFEDADVGETKQPALEYKYDELKRYFYDVVLGRGPFLTRSVNILHVLGSVTVRLEN